MKKVSLLSMLMLLVLTPLVYADQYHPTVGVDVARGDTLTNICAKYLENPRQWPEIAKINRLSDPDRISPGQRIIIPVTMLKGLPVDGVVSFVKGDVKVRETNSQSWKEIRVNDRLQQGYWVKTGDESGLEILFEDNARFFIRSNTELNVRGLSRKGPALWIYQMYLKSGKAISKIRKATGKEPRFKIHTPSAVAVTRGTEFRTSIDSESATRCEVIDGMLQVAAGSRDVLVGKGEGVLVRKDKPPGAPVKLLGPPDPLNIEPIYKEQPILITFHDLKSAQSYRVMVAGDPLFKDLHVNIVIGKDEIFSISNLDDGTYYLQSRSLDENGLEGLPSGTTALNVRVNPTAPYLNSPVSGSRIREEKIVFNWLNVRDAVGYQLQVSGDDSFEQVVVEENNLIRPAFATTALGIGRYFYRVRSVAADGYAGAWSATSPFERIPEPPTPALQPPEMDENQIMLRFKAFGNGYTYRLQMAKDETFEDIIFDEVVPGPHKNIERPTESGSYFIRMSSIDQNGVEGKFSTPQSFDIKPKYPYKAAAFALSILLILLI